MCACSGGIVAGDKGFITGSYGSSLSAPIMKQASVTEKTGCVTRQAGN